MFLAGPKVKNLPAGKPASDFRTFDPGITTYNKEFMINCQVSQENFEKGKEFFNGKICGSAMWMEKRIFADTATCIREMMMLKYC